MNSLSNMFDKPTNIYLVDLDTAQTLLAFDYATLSAVESEE